jgi:hypothetical protein
MNKTVLAIDKNARDMKAGALVTDKSARTMGMTKGMVGSAKGKIVGAPATNKNAKATVATVEANKGMVGSAKGRTADAKTTSEGAKATGANRAMVGNAKDKTGDAKTTIKNVKALDGTSKV